VAGTVITVDPRVSVADYERLAKVRTARDGAVQFAAPAADRRRRRQLRRLRDRLVAGPALDVFGPSDHGDGGVYIWVQPAGARHAAVWGYPVIAAVQAQLDPADVDVQVLGDDFWDALDT
jgi:hypothetical protein